MDANALKLMPLPGLARDMLNFDEWKMAVWFHLRWHNLDAFVLENEVVVKTEPVDGPAAAAAAPVNAVSVIADRRRRLMAYAIIYSSAKHAIPVVEQYTGLKIQRDNEKLNPKSLWDVLLRCHKERFPGDYHPLPPSLRGN